MAPNPTHRCASVMWSWPNTDRPGLRDIQDQLDEDQIRSVQGAYLARAVKSPTECSAGSVRRAGSTCPGSTGRCRRG